MVFTKDNRRIYDVKAWYSKFQRRIFCVSDLHGHSHRDLENMLQEVNFCEDDYLFILGDTIDRGNGLEMLKLLRLILSSPNIELIIGNHELMALNNICLFEKPCRSFNQLTICEDQKYRLWLANGGEPTLNMLRSLTPAETDKIIDLFRNAPLYKEVFIGEKRFILCHSGLGGFDPFKPLDLYLERELTWYRPDLNERWFIDSKTMVIYGHSPSPLLDEKNQGEPILSSTWVNIDCGCALGEDFSPCLFCLNDLTWVKPG